MAIWNPEFDAFDFYKLKQDAMAQTEITSEMCTTVTARTLSIKGGASRVDAECQTLIEMVMIREMQKRTKRPVEFEPVEQTPEIS
jgi:hypothetical protein